MSRKIKEESKSILDNYLEDHDTKVIYNSLLKFGPLTLGELHFITQLDNDKSNKVIKILKENKLIDIVKSPKEMYIALPPITLFSSKLETLENTNEYAINTIKDQMEEINKDLKSNFKKHELLDILSTLNEEYNNNQRQLIVDFKTTYQNSLTEILEKISFISKNTLQERETIHKNALADIKNLIDITNEKIDLTLKDSEKDSSLFLDQLKTNKKTFKKIIKELNDSVEETARSIGSNIQESIKEVEENFVNALRKSISESVTLSQNFRDELNENYQSIKNKTIDLVSTIDDKALKLLNDSIKDNLASKTSENIVTIENTVIPLVKDFNQKLENFQSSLLESNQTITNNLNLEIQKILDEFLNDTSTPKEKLKSYKDIFPSQLGGMSTLLQEKIGRFVNKITQEFERNSEILELLAKEYMEKINEFSEAELRQNFVDNQELGEKIGIIVDKLSKSLIKEAKNWEKAVETVKKNLRDLSANINRRIELFITDTKSELNDNTNEVNDELKSFLNQTQHLRDELNEFKSQVTFSLDDFNARNIELKNSSLDLVNKNKEFTDSLKTERMETIKKEIEEFSKKPLENFNLVKKDFQNELHSFNEEFKDGIDNILDKNKNIIKDSEAQLLDELIYSKNENDEKSKENQSKLDETFLKISTQMDTSIDEAIKNITESFNNLKREFKTDLVKEKETLSADYSELYGSFDNILEKAAQISNQTLNISNEAFSDYFSTFSSRLGNKIIDSSSKLDELETDLKQSSEGIFSKITSQMVEYIDDLGKKSEQSNESLIKSLLEILTNSSEDMKEIQDNTEINISNIVDLFQKIQTAIQRTFSLIDERGKRLDNELNGLLKTNTENLNENINITYSAIDSHIDQIIQSAETKISELENDVKNTAKEMISETDTKINSQIEHLSKTINEYNETKLDTFHQSINQYNDKTQEYQTEMVSITHEISSSIHQTFETTHNLFRDLINRFEVQLNTNIKKTKDNLSKLLNQTTNSIITENIEPSLKSTQNMIETLNLDLENLKNNLMENIDVSLNSIASEIKEIETSTTDIMKTSFNEGNDKLTKLFDSFQTKLMSHETEEVQALREVALKLIEPLELVDTVVSDRISGSINPYQENLEETIDQQRDQFTQNLKKLTTYYNNLLTSSKTLEKKLPEVLTQSLTSTDETIQDYHKVISSELTIYEDKFEEKLDQSITANIEKGLAYLKQSHDSYKKDSQELKEELTSFLENISTQINKVNSETKGNFDIFSNVVKIFSDFLMQENKQGQDFLTEVKRFIAPADLDINLVNIIEFSTKRLNIVVPSMSYITDEMLDKINKKSRTRVITSSSDKDTNTLQKVFKKKGNVTIFKSPNKIPFILVIGEGTKIDEETQHSQSALLSIVSEEKDQGNPGFQFSNENIIEFFDKIIFVTLLKNAQSKLREEVV